MTTYRDYLLSDTWKNKRTSYYKTHKKECRACGKTYKIHLHHKTYIRLGNERDADLVPLCSTCHSALHKWQRAEKINLWRATEEFIRKKRKRRKTAKTVKRPAVYRKKKRKRSPLKRGFK